MSLRRLGLAALTLALWGVVFASPLYAQDAGSSELQTQIDALIGEIIGIQNVDAPQNSSWNTDLSVGSRGEKVSNLQKYLVGEGHLTMPEGVEYGYFGELTRRAVASWQLERGIVPAQGFWGPISRAKASAPEGASITASIVFAATTTNEIIATPGVEGSLVARIVPLGEGTVGTSTYLGVNNSRVSVMDIELSATGSDIRVERLQVGLGKESDLHRDIVSRIYVLEDSDLLAARDLDKITVVEGQYGEYLVTIPGINVVVKAGMTRTLTVAVEARHSINLVEKDSEWTLSIPKDSIRGVDGAGNNVFAPDEVLRDSFRVRAPVLDSASSGDLLPSETLES